MSSSHISRLVEKFLSFDLYSTKSSNLSNNQRAKLALKTFLLYIFYLFNVIFVAIDSQSSNHYLITKTFENRWIRPDFRIQFEKIATVDEIWTFIEEILGANVYSNRTSSTSILWIFEHFLLIGVLRLRQVRVEPQPCQTNEIDQCYPAYSFETRQTNSFGSNAKRSTSFFSEKQSEMSETTGIYGNYDGSGYIVDFSSYDRRWKHFRDEINDLKRSIWLDQQTRALFINLMLYNPSVNVFSSIEFLFEMPFTGGIFPSYRISHRKLFRDRNSSTYVRLVCEIFIVFFTIFFLLMEIVKFVGLRLRYFLSLWNWIDFLHLSISISLIVVFISRSILLENRSIEKISASRTTFDYFTYRLFRLQTRFDSLCLILVSLSIIRTLKYCDFASNLIRIKATIQRCAGDLIGFLIMFVGLMIAFAQFANLTLGQQVAAFSTVGKAFVALFRTVLGDFDYEAIRDASPITGPIFFFLYIFSMVFMLFNMVLAIIVDSYEELGNEYRHVVHQMLIDVLPSIKDAIRFLFERFRLWKKLKIFLRTENSSNQKSVLDLLQTLKYSSQTSSFYDELHQEFFYDLDRLIDAKDFERFIKFAENIRERTRENLFPHISIPNETTRDFCTIQQWSNFKYRLIRLEEVCRLIESKFFYIVEHSEIEIRHQSLMGVI